MNVDVPLFQLTAREYFEVERGIYAVTFLVQTGVTIVGTLLVRKAYLWWQARRAREAIPAWTPPPGELPETPAAVSLDHWPSEPGFGYGDTAPESALGVLGVPLSVLPPDHVTPGDPIEFWRGWYTRQGYGPGEERNALDELEDRLRCGADPETGNRPPEDPPRSVIGPEDPTPIGRPKPVE